jgi:hypothetical protein
MPTLTQAERRKIADLVRAGYDREQIAYRFGTSLSTIDRLHGSTFTHFRQWCFEIESAGRMTSL